LRLQIRSSELELILPRRCKITAAERFIKQRSDWIIEHLDSQKPNPERFLLFGEEIRILQEYDLFSEKHSIRLEKKELKVISPAGSQHDLIKMYYHWLRYAAKGYLIKRTYELAEIYGFKVAKVSIRSQKTRWGSCSVRGNLSFNFKLLQHKKSTIDYVIIHELCHLIEMNHSKNFWQLVEKFCPDFKTLRRELKKNSNI
jgi:predicted metal-dependent hydrolase